MKKPTNCRVHISSGIETSLMELYRSVCEILAVEIAPLIREPAEGQVIRSCLSNELAKNLLGWEPRVPLFEGLKLSLLERRGKLC
jgi:UDP-glucose 4-epimerase